MVMGEDLWIIAKKIGVFVCIQDQKGSFEFAIAYAVIGGFSMFACGFIIGKSDPDLMFGKVFGKSLRNIVRKLNLFWLFSSILVAVGLVSKIPSAQTKVSFSPSLTAKEYSKKSERFPEVSKLAFRV